MYNHNYNYIYIYIYIYVLADDGQHDLDPEDDDAGARQRVEGRIRGLVRRQQPDVISDQGVDREDRREDRHRQALHKGSADVDDLLTVPQKGYAKRGSNRLTTKSLLGHF